MEQSLSGLREIANWEGVLGSIQCFSVLPKEAKLEALPSLEGFVEALQSFSVLLEVFQSLEAL